MNTRLIVLLTAALAAAPALASDFHRDAVGPGSVNREAVAFTGVVICDDPIGALVPAFLCCTGGVGGAIIAMDGSCGANLNPVTQASGDCNVAQSGALLPPTNGDFSYLCGVDRDDDGFVTNHDPVTTDPRGFDDDFSDITPKGTTAYVCFREDIAAAGGDFDDMAVFIALNVPSTSAAVGTFDVDVNLATDTFCTPSGFSDPPLSVQIDG